MKGILLPLCYVLIKRFDFLMPHLFKASIFGGEVSF